MNYYCLISDRFRFKIKLFKLITFLLCTYAVMTTINCILSLIHYTIIRWYEQNCLLTTIDLTISFKDHHSTDLSAEFEEHHVLAFLIKSKQFLLHSLLSFYQVYVRLFQLPAGNKQYQLLYKLIASFIVPAVKQLEVARGITSMNQPMIGMIER